MSFPLDIALQINGFDETFDAQAGSEDTHAGIRIEMLKACKLAYNPACLINQILETHEEVCGWAAWGKDQPRKQKEIVLDDGRSHFANEWLIQDWAKKPYIWAKNEFNLKELRGRVLREGYKAFPTTFRVETDWRDGQLLSDMD